MIYRKLSDINIQIISNNEIIDKQVSILSDSKEVDKLDKINSNLKKINNTINHKSEKNKNKLELVNFDTNMSRFREFLNQSKVFNKLDIVDRFQAIKVNNDSEDHKLFFLSQFSKLLLSNNYTFSDLDINTEYYGYGPSNADSIWFDVENINETKDGVDYKVYEADIVFTLKDKSKLILKYEFFDDTIEQFDKCYDKFCFIDFERDSEPYYYNDSHRNNGKYRIVLNDLYQYIDFIGKNYFNKSFFKVKWLIFPQYEYESLLHYSQFTDMNWQIDSTNFEYLDDIVNDKELEIIDSMSNDELFIYLLKIYYKEYPTFDMKPKIFKVIKYLNKLIEDNYPMAFIVKALLHLDGKIVLKDYEEAKILLKKAYSLGLNSPSMLIWNENNLYRKGMLK